MLESVKISNLTVFSRAKLKVSRDLNVIIGENGTGKTHLLKAIYSVVAASAEEHKRLVNQTPTKTGLQSRIADKLVGVFRPESLGRLARRRQGRERCDLEFRFKDKSQDMGFGFATNSKTEVSIDIMPSMLIDVLPAYLPTRELLSIYPNFVSVYENVHLDFEETWRDTCILLGAPLRRGPPEARIRELLEPLEAAMGGSITLDRSGRFYLVSSSGRVEMPLVAEGVRKLGMVARLIATGALLERGFLFWDEPEASLNPKLIRKVARTIVDLSASGIQVFIATHSLFLLREIEIILSQRAEKDLKPKFFGLHARESGVMVQEGTGIEEIGDITSLDEELQQSDRFLGLGGS